MILTSLPLSFEGGVYSKEKIAKNVGKIYAREYIQLSWKFRFGAIWTRIGGDVIVETRL